ncbi:dihydropteroate synthase [Pedobacter sandarakinus]|uniref:dihydropteroate synthase n=1 Tax=Pedobacter sandarakinus TaxID=353156 RepID=UPI002245881C|nr:dihydropteroate synthase [Pedobacter sandarakinus]MCX2576247.1 dihydropteroate synthase [Pedobacter sandarakinus]
MSEKIFFKPKQSINIKGELYDLSKPKVMAILNITPDSFHHASRTKSIDDALAKTTDFLNKGATFIDVGGYSSRPGATDISANEEADRVVPVVEALVSEFPKLAMSIDTFRAQVAEECISAGAAMINDISAGDMDASMFKTVARLRVPYIMMHMQGTPQNMQKNPVYKDVTLDIFDYLAQKIAELRALNIHDVLIDPGFGFGKTLKQNYKLLNEMEAFQAFNLPILVGVSRKGMIYKTLETTAAGALNGTTVLNTIALQKGASILRVHDVTEAMECIKLLEVLEQQ